MKTWTKIVVIAVAVASAVALYLILKKPPNVASDAKTLLGY